ncbi:hypothetical protein DFH28DRAFT_224989 [Melampsora americana]|nr:hypothetical protein DFH28DRAFT_224989 [Melampsora americana]
MLSIFRWLGAFYYLLLSTLSLQMDPNLSLGEFCSDRLPILSQSKDKNILEGLDVCQKQDIHAQNQVIKFSNWKTQTASPGSRYSGDGLDKTKPAEILDLDLSLIHIPKEKSINFENSKRSDNLERPFDQNIHTLKQVQEEDIHDPFQPVCQPASQFGQVPISRDHTRSSQKSWLTLGNFETGSSQSSKENLSYINLHDIYMQSSPQVDSKRSWLSLGHESNLHKDHSDLINQDIHFDTAACAPGVTSKDNIEESPPRESVKMSSKHPPNHLNIQFLKVGSQKNLHSPDDPQVGITATKLGSLGNQQAYELAPQYIAHQSKGKHKRVRGIGSQKENEKYPHIQRLNNLPYIEAVETETHQMSTSSKKPKPLATDKDMKGPSDSHIQILSPDINLVATIEKISISHKLLPQDLLTEMSTWFDKLEYDICQRERDYKKRNRKTGVGFKNTKPAVSKARALATAFLTCIKLLHQDQHHDVQHWEVQVLVDGWSFIKRIFDEWNILDWKILETIRWDEHVDDFQPNALYHWLESLKPKRFTIDHLWGFWKRWDRESIYPHKRFLPTETVFVKHLQHSISKNVNIINRMDLNSILQGFNPKDRSDGHQKMLEEYILHSHWFKSKTYPSNSIDNNFHLEYMMQHVGQFELDLLEHHEPVLKWLETLLQDMKHQLIKQGVNDKNTAKQISQCLRLTYKKIVPMFLGAMKLIEEPRSTAPVYQKDMTVFNAWSLLKTHLDHWRNMDLKNVLQNKPLEDNHSMEGRDLFVKLLMIKKNFHIPLGMISQLYHLHILSLGNEIVEHGPRFHLFQLKSTLSKVFWDLHRQIK